MIGLGHSAAGRVGRLVVGQADCAQLMTETGQSPTRPSWLRTPTRMQLLLQREPRTLYLVQDDWVLLFRNPPPQLHLASTDGAGTEASVLVQLVHVEEIDLSHTVVVYTRVAGSLGLLKLGDGK